jgi:hypothetical protein
MACAFCTSTNQTEFPAEVNVHFQGLRNVDKPGVFVFPTVLVCLDCGYTSFMTPVSELVQLAGAAPARRTAQGMSDRWRSLSQVQR